MKRQSKVVRGRVILRDTLDEALKTINLYTEAGCPVSVTLKDDGTYVLAVYTWRTKT